MATWRFLAITDIHYELPEANYLDDPKELKQFSDRALWESAFTDFNRLLEWGGFNEKELCFIAIGGDITSHGKQQGFTTFVQSALPKLQDLVASREAICVVPGNHDVVWGLDPTEKRYFDRKFEAFKAMVRNAGVSSCLFPSGELSEPKPGSLPKLNFKSPPLGHPWYKDDDKHVIVLNINSAIRCGELYKQMQDDVRKFMAPTGDPKAGGGGPNGDAFTPEKELKKYWIRDVAHITQQQLLKLEEEMVQLKKQLAAKWQSYLRVGLVHHHLVHYPGQQTEHRGYEFLVDSPRLLDFLKRFDFDIVLTGHKHQAYQDVHRWDGEDLFIVGGPTVGGFSSRESFRGFRLITFESDGAERRIEIINIPLDFAADPDEKIAGAVPIRHRSRSPFKVIFDREAEKAGYRYRDVASITQIAEDGDAHRIVECGDLEVLRKNLPRAKSHVIHLPPTSGYLDQLRVTSSGVRTSASPELPTDQSAKTSEHTLTFHPPLSINKPVSYRYEWLAVNGFAMDTLQYARKYGQGERAQRMKDIEYTHYIPEDPIGELTIIVQFPNGYKIEKPPRLRIAKVDTKVADSRLWETDDATADLLRDNHALRHYESINTAALRVKAPSAGLAYGIEWDLPDAPHREGCDHLDKIVEHLANHKDSCLRTIYRLLDTGRTKLLRGWAGDLDGSLMAFQIQESGDKRGTLKIVAAGRWQEGNIEDLRVEGKHLPYGLGIAGRAFKANRIRVYVTRGKSAFAAPPPSNSRLQPDYYVEIPGTLRHKRLIAFPLHVPVEEKELKSNPAVYQDREPYGVFSLGSESDECPVSELLPYGEQQMQLVEFQDFVNNQMYELFAK